MNELNILSTSVAQFISLAISFGPVFVSPSFIQFSTRSSAMKSCLSVSHSDRYKFRDWLGPTQCTGQRSRESNPFFSFRLLFLAFFQKFMPSIVPLLDKITIISARSTYENQFGNFPVLWKKSCFLDCIHKTFVDSGSKNILAVGDSQGSLLPRVLSVCLSIHE